jgi:hypothetical protein
MVEVGAEVEVGRVEVEVGMGVEMEPMLATAIVNVTNVSQ